LRPDLKETFEGYLAGVVPGHGDVADAMRYALDGGGKRLRPLLLMTAAEAAGREASAVFPAAAAVEAIHQYSLVHDDLPSMDDDDLRRGRPTTHRAFGEAVAILAGDGLQALAFELMASPELAAKVGADAALKATAILAKAAGIRGMVGGQDLDIAGGRSPRDEVNRLKTGALFAAAAAMGGILGGQPEWEEGLSSFGEEMGLAFQDLDDLLDLAQDQAVENRDEAMLREGARIHTDAALSAITPFAARGEGLREFARSLLLRRA